MRAREIINELTDKPEKFSLGYTEEDVWEIMSPRLNLYLYLTRGLGPTLDNNQVFIEFAVNNRYDLTNGGNAIKILSTVISMIKTYLPKFVRKQDQYISFGAEKAEPSRVSLYTRAIPIISGILRIMNPAWKYQTDSGNGSLKVFTWSKETQKLPQR